MASTVTRLARSSSGTRSPPLSLTSLLSQWTTFLSYQHFWPMLQLCVGAHALLRCSMLLVQGRMLRLPLPSYQCSVIGSETWCRHLTSAWSFSISPVSMTCGTCLFILAAAEPLTTVQLQAPSASIYEIIVLSYLLSLLVIACLLSSPATPPSRIPRIITIPPHAPQSIVPDYYNRSRVHASRPLF